MGESEEYKEACQRVIEEWMIDWMLEVFGILK